jgi:hypothetical protein
VIWVDEAQQFDESRDQALADLAGGQVGEVTGQLGHDITRLRLINEALNRGATWATIGQMAMGGLSAKQAKFAAKRLGRQVNDQLAAERMPRRRGR